MKKTLALSACVTLFCAATASAATPVAGETAAGSHKGESVTFVSYGGVYQAGQIAALKEFADVSGVSILSDGPTEVAKLQAQSQAGNVMWDVVDSGDMIPYVYCGTLFERLDFKRIDTSKIPSGQVGECSVPAMNYAAILVYNKKVYGDHPPQSWADFFDTKKFPGTRAMPGYGDAEGYIIDLALLADGVPKDQLHPANIDRALDKYRGMRDHLILWQTGAQSQQLLESGEADMAIVWSGRAKAAVENGASYAPVWKDWVVVKDQLSIPVGAPNRDAAYSLLNAYLGRAAQERLAETTSYSPVNIDARPKLDPLTAQWMTNTPEKLASAFNYDLDYWVKHNAELKEKWAAFITGN
ncbi:extracellular solute-binding protein [Pseudomonas taiwanensis]|uniref:Extracellular solute-binding protein n=1 Tax=Pseudomonas taiwanensis TaxID=470150 RepID=A0ABR6V7J2_9PSED|nr:extracellular solute-binding protein [Pseudomonas taiwanensis]MBC3475822.1 extracellular solute-binding protein [Pseudomonas taiwanensis]